MRAWFVLTLHAAEARPEATHNEPRVVCVRVRVCMCLRNRQNSSLKNRLEGTPDATPTVPMVVVEQLKEKTQKQVLCPFLEEMNTRSCLIVDATTVTLKVF